MTKFRSVFALYLKSLVIVGKRACSPFQCFFLQLAAIALFSRRGVCTDASCKPMTVFSRISIENIADRHPTSIHRVEEFSEAREWAVESQSSSPSQERIEI